MVRGLVELEAEGEVAEVDADGSEYANEDEEWAGEEVASTYSSSELSESPGGAIGRFTSAIVMSSKSSYIRRCHIAQQ